MSYIRENCNCSNCGNELAYAWLFPDGRFEKIPQDCQIAVHNSTVDGFDVSVKCEICRIINIIKFNKQGVQNGH